LWHQIVTPLRETEFSLIERGDNVSLHSVDRNWDHPCQSHYWIRDNQVIWAGAMTREQIRMGRVHDDALKQEYFAKVAWPWWRRAASMIKGLWADLFG